LATGDRVLTLADTDSLWVTALVHQHDWDALRANRADSIAIHIPGVRDTSLQAEVDFVGAEISRETRAVSLVGRIKNPHGKLRPGMFAWAELPTGKQREAVVVPTSAIQRHEQQAFVFTPVGERSFRRVDVETGLETVEEIEITRGLEAGTPVVADGAFFLKSELFLEQEAE
jgi:RND family efflux transporter MFP subunit